MKHLVRSISVACVNSKGQFAPIMVKPVITGTHDSQDSMRQIDNMPEQ